MAYDQYNQEEQQTRRREPIPLTAEQADQLSNETMGKWTPPQIQRIYKDMGGTCGADDLAKFIYICGKRNLDPVMGEVHAEFRWDKSKQVANMVPVIHIDGFRKLADLTGQYDGQDDPVFVHDSNNKLLSCTVRIYRKGCIKPFGATVFFAEYNSGISNWVKMPHVMLSKCAEAAAFRKAFPAALSGVYIREEVDRPGFTGEEPSETGSTGFEVGRKPNGAAAATAPEPIPTSNVVTMPAPAPPATPPPPAATSATPAQEEAARLMSEVKDLIEKGNGKGWTEKDRTTNLNVFLRAALGVRTLKDVPAEKFHEPLRRLSEILRDTRAQVFYSDPAAAAKLPRAAPAPGMEAMFDKWKWEPIIRESAKRLMQKQGMQPVDFVKWVDLLHLADLAQDDVLAFLSLADRTREAHRVLKISDRTGAKVFSIVSDIAKVLQTATQKTYLAASEQEIVAAIDQYEKQTTLTTNAQEEADDQPSFL